MQQFKRFCLIGGVGFVIDCLCFALLIWLLESPMLARLMAFLCAASTTWVGNRAYTFRYAMSQALLPQWYRHMSAASLSCGVNLLVFWIALPVVSVPAAFCMGVILGTFSNYFMSRYFVFAESDC